MRQSAATQLLSRQDRRIAEHHHDPYIARHKPPGPAVCSDCGVLFKKGRWQWPTEGNPETYRKFTCPACHRIRDRYPAGWLRLSGRFLAQHQKEILHLVRNQEELENKEHPLNRIMAIEREDGDILISTTDIHLPRRLGTAIHHACKGDLEFAHEIETCRLRVRWQREE